ncbi:MAG: enoyl-CoA hydratase, partial [Actinomycetota bacterium]|nr:enoyl-CoA hydratase [Actinomycetota bacterium]
ADQLDAEVDRYTAMLSLGGPKALAATKDMLRRERATDMSSDFAEMLDLSAGFFASEEGQEGIAAFAQKRKPNWVPE